MPLMDPTPDPWPPGEPAPILRRLLADLIDALPVLLTLVAAAALVWFNQGLGGSLFANGAINPNARFHGALVILSLVVLPLAVLAWILVGAISAWRNRPSPGKWIMGLRVMSEPGREHQRGRRVMREVLWKGILPVASLAAGIWGPPAYLAAMLSPVTWRSDRRGFHDLISGVVVVRAPASPASSPEPTRAPSGAPGSSAEEGPGEALESGEGRSSTAAGDPPGKSA